MIKHLLLICFFTISIENNAQILKDSVGIASYYADKFDGRKTSNGEKFDNSKYTAAHRTLPFGTNLLVTNPKNNKQVVVKINDRGPFSKNRLIDLSKAAAKELDLIATGIGKVHIKVLDSLPANIEQPIAIRDSISEVSVSPIDTTNVSNNIDLKEIEKKWYYGIQVGSFKELENIEKVKKSIAEITNETVFVFEYSKDNTILYQVVIGNFENQKAAIALRKKIQSKFKDAFVTHYKN